MRDLPEHYFDYGLIELLVDLLQDAEQVVYTKDDIMEVFNLICFYFPDEGVEYEDVEKYFNILPEELDIRAHMNAIGVNY